MEQVPNPRNCRAIMFMVQLDDFLLNNLLGVRAGLGVVIQSELTMSYVIPKTKTSIIDETSYILRKLVNKVECYNMHYLAETTGRSERRTRGSDREGRFC